MKNKIVDIVPKLIRQVVGRGSHQLHELSFQIENLSMCQKQLRRNLFLLREST